MTDRSVNLEVTTGHVGVVTLDRPPVNALGRDLREQLIATFDEIQDRDDIRAVVLTANGRIFCAGADIKEKHTLGTGAGDQVRANRLTRDVFFCVLESKKPVIGAINGHALGAGFVLAAACDMLFAAEGSLFAMPEIDVGLGGGASFLQRVLPLSKMRRMMLTGERVPAEELYRLGTVEACVPTGQLLDTALEVAERIATKSPTAVQTIKDAFLTVESLSIQEGFRIEQTYTTELSRTSDAMEARLAFIEKRAPRFE